MNQPTLGLLEKLRPPPGFRTEAAFGATYSADLLTCMAVLTTLDGADGEQVRYGRIEAYRALDRLRDKVRIYCQAGCVSRRDGLKYPSLALLDRVLVPIRLPDRGSFHPKVWLVRQVDESSRERFVLIVSSRNVTTSTDWDLGIVVDGTPGGTGIALPGVRAFVEYALALADEPTRFKTFGGIDDVRWSLPPHVQDLSFDFQPGGNGPRRVHPVLSSLPAGASRMLLLSPFIDDRMIGEAAARWGRVPSRRLVAGSEGLITVALGKKRDALRALEPRQMASASETAEPPEEELDGEREDEIEDARALHAKVIAFDDGRNATILIGSNNLTSAGWCGGSTEAFVRIVGDAALSNSLWEWAGAQAEFFEFPEPGTPLPKQPILEQAKDQLHAVLFRLEDAGIGAPSRLILLDPERLELPDGVRLEVARYTTPRESVPFPIGAHVVELRGCPDALRTRFVVCRLRHGDDETAWIAAAALEPPLDDGRDRELVARLLGLKEFLAYLQSLGSDYVIPGTIEGDQDDDSTAQTSSSGDTPFVDNVHLEGILRQMVAEPEAFEEMDRTVTRYGELIKKSQLSIDERSMLDRFLSAWSAIREAFRS